MNPAETTAPFRYCIALSVAGSDSSGGAGIQADLKTMSALGVFGATVITSVTAQNTHGVQAVWPMEADCVRAQLRSVLEDLRPAAVKIGMISTREQAEAVADMLETFRPPWVVYDPVMVSSSGMQLLPDEALWVVCRRILPLCSLLTPNLPEAEILCGRSLATPADRLQAAREIALLGSAAVLLKGGHLCGSEMEDVLWDARAEQMYRYSAPRIETNHAHGTGCTLSSAIASFLARGENLPAAVAKAKDYLSAALRAGADCSTGSGAHGPMNHFFDPHPLLKNPASFSQKEHSSS